MNIFGWKGWGQRSRPLLARGWVTGWPAEERVPTYRIRDMDAGSVADLLSGMGLVRTTDAASGDVLLCMVAARQPHLGIAGPDGWIHAHAGLRRVVLVPGASSAGERWRLTEGRG